MRWAVNSCRTFCGAPAWLDGARACGQWYVKRGLKSEAVATVGERGKDAISSMQLSRCLNVDLHVKDCGQ